MIRGHAYFDDEEKLVKRTIVENTAVSFDQIKEKAGVSVLFVVLLESTSASKRLFVFL